MLYNFFLYKLLVKRRCLIKKSLVIITGGGSGIGRACAQLFAEKGTNVIITGRNMEKLQETQKLQPEKITPYAFDLNDKNASLEFSEVIKKEGAPVQTLIHNAAIFEKKAFLSTNDLEWEQMFQTNLIAPVRLTRLLLPLMEEGSSIINIASTLGLRPTPLTSAYSASKAAMINWTKTLALELAPKIRVNVVCPGMVETPIHDFYRLPEAKKQQIRDELGGIQPMGRIGQPHDISGSVYFLASQASSWTTGAILSVDGGINL